MNRGSPSPREVVRCVLEAWRTGASDETIVARLVQAGVSHADALDAPEIIRSGTIRAGLIGAGLPSNQISSNIDDHPIFRAAVDAGRLELLTTSNAESSGTAELLNDLKSDDISARRTAAYELGGCKDRAGTIGLLSAVNDPDTYVRVYAIQSLSRLRSTEAIEPCAALLRAGAPRIVMVNAIKTLAEIGDSKAVPALIEATIHEDAFIRHDAAWALGQCGDSRAIPALEALMADETIPVEKDDLGLTTQTSIYTVADQARRSLRKLSTWKLIRGCGIAISLVFAAAGMIILGITGYSYLANNSLSKVGLTSGLVALALGTTGLITSLPYSRR